MARHSAADGGQVSRGAHRAGPTGSGPLANLTNVVSSTTPRRVRPPRPLRVFVVSGLVLSLLLLGYSTTLVNLRFTEPPVDDSPEGSPNSQLPAGQPSPGEGGSSPSQLPSAQARDTLEPAPSSPTPTPADEEQNETDSPNQTESETHATPTLSVDYGMTEWGEDSFGGHLIITNGGSSAISNWEIEVSFTDAQLVAAWEADWEPTSSGARFQPPHWQEELAPGESTRVQFSAEGRPQTPECTINGESCQL
ncbi:cellulose binding domain-containing protein [Lipingzhangella sp. LS1_29]|uniref:Cellulose binding domain-containing protein n=1 Tax=Lipingzhangella rawalii TaxID=2055835 RepID=A0ABU2H5Q5_9ACTN|nr:cellulose binding domain-containing protein [Lipingzhangella rawalii]MDS1270641.1 cellulose binding domain-containing protein [Lipingzhangella rawalii]